MFREQIEMEVNFLKDLVILLSIYKYLEIPWGDPNTKHTEILIIIHLNIFTFSVLHLVVTTNISYS